MLPFENLLDDEEFDYISRGITRRLINKLSSSLDVTLFSAVHILGWQTADPRAVGRQLGVDTILRSTFSLREGRLLITVELLDGNSGAQLLSKRFDRDVDDLFAMQDELTIAITEFLSPVMFPQS